MLTKTCFVLATTLLIATEVIAVPPPPTAVYGAYVLLAQTPQGEPVAFARVIIDTGYPCPTIAGGNHPIVMTTRDNPHGFSVLVCEAAIGFEQTLRVALSDGEIALPRVSKKPTHIIAFGDTGCKVWKQGETSGCAPGSLAMPFAQLASAAASGPPAELILHMGDYNYRGTPGHVLLTEIKNGVSSQKRRRVYDAGDGEKKKERCQQTSGYGFVSQNAANSNARDTWEKWRNDFFRPAGALLTAAPWVFARGNHELCSRAGPGWFYFLDPSSNLPAGGGRQLRCPVPDRAGKPIDNVVLRDPYAVDLGTLTIVVLDSANACDAFAPVKAFSSKYQDQFKRVRKLTPDRGTTWLMSHRPIWGVTKYRKKESTGCTSENQYGCINLTLQESLKHSIGTLPAGIKLVVSGHMHRFQSLTFTGGRRPPQLIFGNGGVELAESPPTGSFTATVAGDSASGRATGKTVTTVNGSMVAFGYLDFTYDGAGSWTANMVNPPHALYALTIADCGSQRATEGSVCEFAPDIMAE